MQQSNLTVTIRRSHWVLVYLLSLHGVMCWTLWQLDMPFLVLIVLSVCLVCSVWYQLGRYQWRCSRLAVVAVSYQAADHNTDAVWILRYSDNSTSKPHQLVSSVVLAELVMMQFQQPLSRWWMHAETVFLLASDVDKDTFRQLRIHLRQGELNEADLK